MRKTVYYRYNQSTGHYDRVYPSRKGRIFAMARHIAIWVVLAAALVSVGYTLFAIPGQRQLREQNRQLRAQLGLLDRRADALVAVMSDVIDRDNNFYRVMMQADRITDARRYAGLERQRLYGEPDSLADAQLLRRVTDKLDLIGHQVYSQIKSFDQLRDIAMASRDRLDHIPAIQPISDKYLKQMASGYGYRSDPVYRTLKFHEGLDYSADIGTPVYATGDGTVELAGWNKGYGNSIDISHGYNYLTRYAHLSEILVRQGQKVRRGDMIGKVGNTGKSTGPHLHYEVRLHGQPQNPVNYYFYDLTPEQYDDLIRLSENAGHVMD